MAPQWYAKSPQAIWRELRSGESGLSAEEARRRLNRYGPNVLPEPQVPGRVALFLAQFLSPLIYVLMAAALVVLFMGQTADAAIIALILVFNAAVGAIQEGKAQRTLLALRTFVATAAAVLRDGKTVIVPDADLVPGDIVILQEGDKVPADARLLSAYSLTADESGLSGESVATTKTAARLRRRRIPLQDQRNMVFKGTRIVSGNATAIVVATGLATEIGSVSEAVASIDTDVPLKRNIRVLSRLIIGAVGVIGIALISAGIAEGKSLQEMFATVVSLSVSIIPEGLPIVTTLVLASGVWRMAKRHVLVKKLQAVEALGQATVIAVDKTGTLTKNEMVVEKVYVNGQSFDVQGRGYEPNGEILRNGSPIEPLSYPELVLAGQVATFCSDAYALYVEGEKIWKISGDPTEAALGVFGRKIGFHVGEYESPKIFDLPFDYLTKYHATIHERKSKNFLTVVGAPEVLLSRAERVWQAGRSVKLSRGEREKLTAVFTELSEKGFRVLAFAVNAAAPATLANGRLPALTFGGFFSLADPLRDEAAAAIQTALRAGIRVVMMTGDHTITARAVAIEAGLARPGADVITGEELERLSDQELISRFGRCRVFARVTPEHKLRIIELFRRRGDVVAMTGDGVNDAPSLAAADLGVAMGKIGTEVAKEAADLVLLDDNFGNIIAAAEEGRSIYRTIQKVVLYLFSTSIGEVLTIAGAMFMGLPLPILPAQIIWLNFVTDGFLDVALAMEPKEAGLLTRRAGAFPKYLLNPAMAARMAFMGIVIALGSIFIFTQYLGGSVEKALTISLTTLAIFQWFNAWNCKSHDQSVFALNPFKNIFLVGATITVIALQAIAVYHPFMQRYLHTVPLTALDWLQAAAVAASLLALEEVRKLVVRNWPGRAAVQPVAAGNHSDHSA